MNPGIPRREDVFRQVLRYYAGAACVAFNESALPSGKGVSYSGPFPIYHFAIRFHDYDRVSITTWGPHCYFEGGWNGPQVETVGTYSCWMD